VYLTPKGFRLCFHQKHSKTAISKTSTKFLNFFWTHITVGSCKKIGLRRCGKKFRIFHRVDCKILAFELTKILFLTLRKNGQLHFTSSHLYEKMSQMVVTLWIHSSWQVGYMLEKNQIIWNCTTYRKKIVSRKKEIMIQNTKLLTIYLWNWKMPIPMVVMVR